METLQLDKKNARKAYSEADTAGKKLLANLLGKDVFRDNPIEYIKTLMDVCEEAGVEFEHYKIPTSGSNEEKAAMYLKRLKLIASVFNGEWKADLGNTEQRKYYPWFNIVPNTKGPSGFGLSFSGDGCGRSYSNLGARPYFKDSDTAVYVGKQFLSDFEGWAQYTNLSE